MTVENLTKIHKAGRSIALAQEYLVRGLDARHRALLNNADRHAHQAMAAINEVTGDIEQGNAGIIRDRQGVIGATLDYLDEIFAEALEISNRCEQ